MSDPQPNNPLHGIKLEQVVTQLQAHYGWDALAERVNINCFKSDPSVKSSLKFLRRTLWAREKVEALFVDTFGEAINLRAAEALHLEAAEAPNPKPAEALSSKSAEALHLDAAEAPNLKATEALNLESAEAPKSKPAQAPSLRNAEALDPKPAQAPKSKAAPKPNAAPKPKSAKPRTGKFDPWANSRIKKT